ALPSRMRRVRGRVRADGGRAPLHLARLDPRLARVRGHARVARPRRGGEPDAVVRRVRGAARDRAPPREHRPLGARHGAALLAQGRLGVSRAAVLGAGSFGTTLAIHLAHAGHDVRLGGRDPEAMGRIARERENRKFLAGIALPVGVKVHAELETALEAADFLLFVVPSQALRSVARQVAAAGARGVPICASKGLELGTLRRLSEVLSESLGDSAPVTLTGPSHAEEVVRGIPTTVVAASADEARARDVQLLCSTPRFRVYTNADVAGCEYGGALKNVIAIAAGVCDGLGFG